jgi:hypothetical protein
MATVQIEIDEATGQPKDLPEALKKHVDGLVDAGFKARHAALRTDLEKQFAEKYKPAPTLDATERERLKLLDDENQRFKTAEAERKAEYDKALKIREEAEAKREDERKRAADVTAKELARRDQRLRELARDEIKVVLMRLGAHDDGLDILAEYLGAKLDLDADLKTFVKGADGQPAVDKDGNPVTVEGFVREFLTTKKSFVAAASGTGGGARGGAHLTSTHLTGDALVAQRKVDEIEARMKAGDRSDVTINELYEAKRVLRKAASGGR